jgi:hypothetical protein
MIDPDLDAMLADLRTTQLGGFQAVRVLSGSEETDGAFDDGDLLMADGTGERVQISGAVVRFREGSITRPAINGTLTLRTEERDVAGKVTTTETDYRVRQIFRDPGQPGALLVTLAAA